MCSSSSTSRNSSHLPDAETELASDAANTQDTGATSAYPHRDEEYSLPCAEAVLAGTLALMTGHAQACCCSQRAALSEKVVAGLQQLAHSSHFTPHFRALLGSLQRKWVKQCAADAQAPRSAALQAAEQRRALWVQAPRTVQ